MYGKSRKFIARITPLLVLGGWLSQAWAGIVAVAVLTVIPFCAFAASGPTNLISWGWNSPTAEYVNNNLTSMEGRPFDGVIPATVVTHGYYFGGLALTNIPITRADVQSDIDNLKTASSSNVLTQNFYQLYVAISNEPPDWFDDWTTPLNNIRLMAQIMKEAGLKGILIDTETYNSSFFDYETRKYSATKTFTEYKAQVRLRGQELVQVINSVVPNISLLATYCFSLTLGGGHPNYDLLDAFCDGMVQGADVGTILHEITELAYAYKSAQQFSALHTDLRSAAVKASQAPAKLFTNYRIGFGIWVDYRSNDQNCAAQGDWNTTNFTCNWFSPTEFKNSVFEALKHADTGSYVWIYDQIPNWWTEDSLPAEYLTALRDAKNLYIAELNGDFAPPTVSLNQSANGSSVSDTVTVSALAVDNVGVAGVQFQLDGRNIGVEDVLAPYAVSWDVKSVPNGFHTLSAIARDAAGNTAISAAVTIAVNNTLTISDPVAHWELDETSGTAVSDSSRKGHTGALINSPSWTPGKIDGGLQFHNGASGYVSVPDHPLFKPTHAITLSAWIYPTAYNPPGYYQGIIFKGGKQYGCCYQPAYALGLLPTGELRFAIGDRSSYEAYNGPKIPLNAWTHVAAVRMNTNDITLYINSSPVSGGEISALEEFFYTSAPLYLAASNGGWGSNPFDGMIDDVRIYSRGLQSAEVQALYNLGTDDTIPPEISNLRASFIAPTSATITWSTNEPSTSQVDYGFTTSYDQSTPLNAPLVASHSLTLSFLSANTTYHYRVRSKDVAGNEGVSIDKTFTTPPAPDTTPPAAITNLTTSHITRTSAILSWTASGDDGATGSSLSYDIRYATSPITNVNWGSARRAAREPAPHPTGSQEFYTLAGLTRHTTYYVAIKTRDEAGNVSPLSNVLSFKTRGRVPIFPVNTCNEEGIRAGCPVELTTEPASPMMFQRR